MFFYEQLTFKYRYSLVYLTICLVNTKNRIRHLIEQFKQGAGRSRWQGVTIFSEGALDPGHLMLALLEKEMALFETEKVYGEIITIDS